MLTEMKALVPKQKQFSIKELKVEMRRGGGLFLCWRSLNCFCFCVARFFVSMAKRAIPFAEGRNLRSLVKGSLVWWSITNFFSSIEMAIECNIKGIREQGERVTLSRGHMDCQKS